MTADKVDLLRVVVSDGFLSPDPRAQLPGRGAYVHPDPGCLEAADRRRAFARAFRLTGPLDAQPLRSYLAEHSTDRQTGGQPTQEAGPTSMSVQR